MNKELKAIEGKNSKKDLTVDDKILIKELEDKIASMKKDKEAKCKSAKKQLIDMLDITMNKYLTATGTAEALRLLKFIFGEDECHINEANNMAQSMAEEVEAMKEKADTLSYADMDKLCEGFYEQVFEYNNSLSNFQNGINLAYEMMRIDLCRNVGGAAEDMVAFIKRVQEEIDTCGEELKKLKSKEQ